MKFLVTYDIQDDKVRKKVFDILEEFGFRVNLSVFEIELNQTKLNKLKPILSKIINTKKDSLRFYYVCENCLNKSFELGSGEEFFKNLELFI